MKGDHHGNTQTLVEILAINLRFHLMENVYNMYL